MKVQEVYFCIVMRIFDVGLNVIIEPIIIEPSERESMDSNESSSGGLIEFGLFMWLSLKEYKV